MNVPEISPASWATAIGLLLFANFIFFASITDAFFRKEMKSWTTGLLMLLFVLVGAFYLYAATMPMPDHSASTSDIPIPNHPYWGFGKSIICLAGSVGLGVLLIIIREQLPFLSSDGTSSSGEEELNEE